MNNRVLEKFKAGKPSLGTFEHMKSTAAVDALSYTGLDYIIIDVEHGPVDNSDVDEYVGLAKARGLSPFVRINGVIRSQVMRPLDVGAHGLIVPYIKSLDECKRLVDWGKFKPVGDRGFCPSRDDGWGMAPQALNGMQPLMDYDNENTMIVPQCETVECLEIVEQVVGLEGIDGIFIGPFDLSIAMGIPGEFKNPDFLDAIRRVREACQSAGKPCIIFSGSTEMTKGYIADGFDSVTQGIDVTIMQQAVAGIVKECLPE